MKARSVFRCHNCSINVTVTHIPATPLFLVVCSCTASITLAP